jgi:hypothetical protein
MGNSLIAPTAGVQTMNSTVRCQANTCKCCSSVGVASGQHGVRLLALFRCVQAVDGSVRQGDRVRSAASGEQWEVLELGVQAPERHPTHQLLTGQVGYVITGQKVDHWWLVG